jgi:hypothetical protein
MKRVHIVVGDLAAVNLKAALDTLPDCTDDIFVVKDLFNIGPLRSEEMPFSGLRKHFLQEMTGMEKIEVDDLERLMNLSTDITNDKVQQVCFWMSGIPADVCTYFWLLHFLKKHMGKLYVININGLPFVDEEGKLFYPASIADLPLRQVIKAQKLARAITPSEWETDGDEWKRLIQEAEVGVRINTGGKRIEGKPIDFYDKDLLALATNNNQKISKLVGNAMTKNRIFTGDTFLIWRLKQLALAQLLTITKDSVKLYSGASANEETLFEEENLNDNG